MARFDRRHVLGALASAGAAAVVDPGPLLARFAAQHPCADPSAAGSLLRTLPLSRAGAPVQPFGVKFGRGLDARLVTDLSLLEPDTLITPNRLAYIRTECPPAVAARKRPWTIEMGRPNDSRTAPAASLFTVDDLARQAGDMGAHLFECAGNNNPANFGLMSVAEWRGVPLTAIVSRLGPSARASAVLVNGVDYQQGSNDSIAGAGWIFPLPSLDSLGAFLAIGMNGEPLPLDHGSPIRLVVPGWYGCAWIKWVHEIRLVGADEPATGQMREFAGRTHQSGRHDLARDYAPAEIHAAATPVRVEQRRGPAGLVFRIVGIVWGGTRPVERLEIRFSSDDGWQAFDVCPAPRTHRTWSLWDYHWKPPRPGVYDIALRVPDPSVPQRRLDSGYYTRQVRIDAV
jgi:DMSO/TMAO reductase YedYZ molybdopterin-dependent catalytic subunit